MTRQQVMRRMILGAFVVTLVLPGLGTAAEPYAEGSTSGAGFKGYCEDGGGIFTDTEDGNLWCQWDDDSQTVCDEDGQDCYDIPYIPPQPRGPELGIEPTTQGGSGDAAPSSPEADNFDVAGAQPSLVARDTDQHHDHSTRSKGKGKHGKHGKKGAKHHQR